MLSLFPSLRSLTPRRALRDMLAGVQLAAMNIPQALGYARIAGMPVITGLYTLLLPPLAFAAFGSSPFLVVAADSATAAILYSGLSALAPVGGERYVELAGMVALITAALLLLARLLKLGFLADFLSRTVLVGFLTGVGVQVAVAVLGGMLGLEISAHQTIHQIGELVQDAGQVHLPTLEVSVAVVAGILLCGRISCRLPASLVAVIAGIAASAVFDFPGHGILTIGPLAGGLPRPTFPGVTWRDAEPLIGIAMSCFIVILAQSAATARIYAARHRETLDENADLLGLCAANAVAGVSGTFVVNGSPTQTAMVESSGGRSQLAQISTAVVVAVVLLALQAPLQYLPRCVLNGIVFVIALRLIDLGKMASIRRESPGEYWLALIAAIGVVVAGVEAGIVLAMVLSLLRIVSHSYRPHTGVLLPDKDVGWKLLPAERGTSSEAGLVVYRFGAPLFYANAERFAEEINGILGPEPSPVRWVLVDAEAITNLDYSAARVVCQLAQQLAERGVVLAFARVSSFLQADLTRHHVEETIGPEHIFPYLHEALDAFRNSSPRVTAPQPATS